MYECLYQEQTNKKENRESCVTGRYKKKMSGCTIVTVLKYMIWGIHTYQ